MKARTLPAILVLLFARLASAQYNAAAGTNAPTETKTVEERGRDGTVVQRKVQVKAQADRYGNAAGNQNDLAVDGAFTGQTVAVIQLYAFDLEATRAALAEKGYSVYRWSGRPPEADELERALAKSSQLWIISGDQPLLSKKHLAIIKKFFDAGHGVYIWGDNDPYYADANAVAEALFGARMLGDVRGDQVVGLMKTPGKHGLLPRHLLTTGIEFLYEGITIATIQPNQALAPLLYGSADNLVSAIYDHDGKRAVLDGGFTRLYNKWDTAGTARYVKNAAAWLSNVERFPVKTASR